MTHVKPPLDRSRMLEAGPHFVYHLAEPNVVYFLHEKRSEQQLNAQECLSIPTMWLDDHTLLMPLHHIQRVFGSTSSCVQYENFPAWLVGLSRFKMASSTNRSGNTGREYVAISRADVVRWYEFASSPTATAAATTKTAKAPRLFTHGPHRALGCYEWLRKCCLAVEYIEQRGRHKAHDPLYLAQTMCQRVPFLAPLSAANLEDLTSSVTTEEEDDYDDDDDVDADENTDDDDDDGGENGYRRRGRVSPTLRKIKKERSPQNTNSVVTNDDLEAALALSSFC